MSKKLCTAGICSFWFILIAYLSYKMPFFVDDYIQSKSFATGENIKGIGMIFDSIKVSYQTFNGRAITMFFIQLMLYLPRPVFAVCNALVYVALANLIVKYIIIDDFAEKWSTWVLSLVFLCMWFFMPDFAEVVIWPSGCITYMWMNLIILSFGYLYYKDFLRKRYDASDECAAPNATALKKLFVIIGHMVLGFFAGWSAEASAGATIFGIMLFFIWAIVTKHKITIEEWLGFLTCMVGYCLLVFAPANRTRVADAESTAVARGVLATYGYRFVRETYYTFIFLLIPIAISVALFVLARKREENVRRIFIGTICKEVAKGKEAAFWLIAFASIYIMTFSAGFANRIYQFPLLMIIIAMGISFMSIIEKMPVSNMAVKVKKSIASLCLMLMLLAATEVLAGSLYAKVHNSFFDRQVIYYYLYDTQGIIPEENVEK